MWRSDKQRAQLTDRSRIPQMKGANPPGLTKLVADNAGPKPAPGAAASGSGASSSSAPAESGPVSTRVDFMAAVQS